MSVDPTTVEGALQLYTSLTEEERAGLRQLHDDTRGYGRTGLAAAKAAWDLSIQINLLAGVHRGMADFLQSAYRSSYAAAVAEKLIRPIACAKGCAFCCYLNVEATIFGAAAIAAYLRTTRLDLVPAVFAVAPNIAGLDAVARAAHQIACPFLEEDNACGVYAVRPLSCGSYFSFDAGACEGDRRSGGTAGNIPVYGFPGVLNTMITGGLSAACAEEGLQNCTVELTAAVALILDDSTALPRWLRGEQVFTPYR